MEEKKGIVFKKVKGEREVHAHPDTIDKYFKNLPRNEKGWIVFKYQPQSRGRVFAKIEPK